MLYQWCQQWCLLSLTIVIPLLLLGGCIPKPTPLSPEELREVLRERIREIAVPGFSVAVTKGDRVIWSAGYGLADVAPSDFAKDTNFSIVALIL